jgi:hypothetical protein
MNGLSGNQLPDSTESLVPKIEWLKLLLTGAGTILLLACATEWFARFFYPVSLVDFDKCFVIGDRTGTAHAKSNGVCIERSVQNPRPVEYRFNSRGDRAATELTAKPPGTYRIVIIGSSMAMGLYVAQPKTFAALLPAALSKRTGRHVEVYNMATGGMYRGGPFPTEASLGRIDDALAAAPDLILWVITPMDVANAAVGIPTPIAPASGDAGLATLTKRDNQSMGGWERTINYLRERDWTGRLRTHWDETRTAAVLKHWLLSGESTGQYVTAYLKNDSDAAFLKSNPDPRWRNCLAIFERDAGRIVRQATSVNIRVFAVLVPNRAQAAMLSRAQWPAGYDPYALDDELRAVMRRTGAGYLDIFPDIRSVAAPERYYFPADGHLNERGHAMISAALDIELTHGPLAVAGDPRAVNEPSQEGN